MSRVKNHRICVHGHQTSLRLESELWYLLRRMAAEIGTTAVRLIECISAARDPDRSLSSEIRVCIATYFARQVPQTGFPDRASRFAFRVVDSPKAIRAKQRAQKRVQREKRGMKKGFDDGTVSAT
jgi:predicted DNA-binding ribbon-helix-helix protein